ncbi:hypothetical protein JB92DRAFT_2889835 [Gautieria morchelliformis]|nr:hypothetical protein JB92DRAFT_2889835 [Gautieria morchelliformis]
MGVARHRMHLHALRRTVVALAVSRMGEACIVGHDEGVVSAMQVMVMLPTHAVTLDKVRVCSVAIGEPSGLHAMRVSRGGVIREW